MKSILVALIVGVVASLIAGLLLLPEASSRLTIQVLGSLALQHWGWSLIIIVVSALSGLGYRYRLPLGLLIIEKTPKGPEVALERFAPKGTRTETVNQTVEVRIGDPLMGWDKEGDWIPDTSHDPPDLRVTNSDTGGILRKTVTWTDYEFEFETKIDRDYTAWIIRAYDRNNYVMLQCGHDKITPLYRRDGLWWSEKETKLAEPLPKGWFKICIRVEEEAVSVFLHEDGQRTVLFKSSLLGPRSVFLTACRPSEDKPNYVDGEVFVSYLRGGVGFRACGHESAYFRNIAIRPIVDDE